MLIGENSSYRAKFIAFPDDVQRVIANSGSFLAVQSHEPDLKPDFFEKDHFSLLFLAGKKRLYKRELKKC
ncbi:MAG TPA: hypothetical protein VIX17_07080 [Pyrinomonadaceae bacterium]|jgi:hypothetical protein